MKIAITGGEGFIGQRLIPVLQAAGHTCIIIDKRHAVPVDVRDEAALQTALKGCDAIYHLAAEHSDNVQPISLYYDVNVQGTKNLLKCADHHGIKRVIFTSSFAIYGLNTGCPDETAPAAPFNDYGKSKWEAEEVLQAWAAQDPSACLTIIRPVVVFGEGNRGNVYNLIEQIARGKFVMVGNGKNRKSIAYVGNVAAFLYYVLNQPDSVQVYNYADKPDLDMNTLIDVIHARLGKPKSPFRIPYSLGWTGGWGLDVLSRLTGRTFPVSAIRVEKFCADTVSSAEKSRRIGFVPEWSLDDGLKRMIDHDFPAQGADKALRRAA